ncbi:MAG: glutaredoxin family protein [Rubrivivax sp.]|nr:MAG: glutaredoxin family protein [Rubrivivax sp.]
MPSFDLFPVRHSRSLRRAPAIRLAGVALGLLMAGSPAFALYKVVGADGKVTYTDRPPTDRASQAIKTNGSVSDTGSLPFELRQINAKFPVTLYTSRDCGPCDQGRNLLKQRGIPFVERTVQSNEDIAAFKRQEGGDQMPVVRIGGQQIKGFSPQDWQSYLDAAGYPKESTLPRTYQWPAPAPMVQQSTAGTAPATTTGSGTGAGNRSTTAPTTPPPQQPGIRF